MPRRFRQDDDDEEDRDAPLPSDQEIGDEDDDDLDPMPCPYCGKTISERHEVCPHCHSFILREDVPKGGRPRWVVVTMIVVILALTFGLVAFR